MAGLLDFEDPNTAGAMQLGLGLLNAGGPSRMPVSLGQGIAQGGTMAMDAMRQARQDLLKKKLAQLEIEKGQLTIDQVKKELAKDEELKAAFKSSYQSPEQQALAAGGQGPTNAAAATIPSFAPKLDQKGLMGKLMGIDPVTALKFKEYLEPKMTIVGENQRALMPDAAAPTGFKTVLDAVPKEKKAPEGMVYDDKGILREAPGYVEMKSKIAAAGRAPAAPVQHKQPVAYKDPATGKFIWGGLDDARGKEAGNFSPTLQGEISRERERGKNVGEQQSQLPTKENALESIGEAKAMLKAGIYTGAWGPTTLNIMKMTPGTDKTKAERTEAFIAYIGNVVVPRLKEFGGNDSNEELKYLKDITGGNIKLEMGALEKILESAEKKMAANIAKLKRGSQSSNTMKFDAQGNPI